MLIKQRTLYALRAIFELARRMHQGPVKTSEIARTQHIPLRFLEKILSQLKRGSLVGSKRGYHGGYWLVQPPEQISVGDIYRLMQDTVTPGNCIACESKTCPFQDTCVFLPLWTRVQGSIFDIYDNTSVQDLLDENLMKKLPNQ